MKTAMLFTIALSYLVFGGSSILLIGNLIIGVVKTVVGSDILITSMFSSNFLPEKLLREFMDNEMNKSSSQIEAFSFLGQDLGSYLDDTFQTYNELKLSTGGKFPENKIRLYPADENYLDSSLIDYYLPMHQQENIKYEKSQGKIDLIKSLFSNEGIEEYGNNMDPYDVVSQELSVSDVQTPSLYHRSQQIKAILPLGIKSVLSIDGGDTIELSITQHKNQRNKYRFLIRGLPKKVPGFFFMSYKQVRFFLQGIISFPQAFEIANLQSLGQINKPLNAESSFNYPKERLLVRVTPNLSDEKRNSLV